MTADRLMYGAAREHYGALIVLGMMMAGVAVPLGFGLANRGSREGTIVVDERGLQVKIRGQTTHVHHDLVHSAVIIVSAKGCRVELNLHDDTTLAIELDEHAQGELLLSKLRAGGRAAEMRIGMQTPPPLWMGFPMLVALLLQIGIAQDPSAWMPQALLYFPILPMIVGLMVGLAVSSTHVVVGDDGLQIRRGWWRRFVAFDRIKEMHQDGSGRLIIALADGAKLKIGSHAAGHSYAQALMERIQRAMSPEGGATAALLHVLGRGDRSLAEWRDALRGLFTAEPGYRGPRWTKDDALAVVADATRDAQHRLGAALALFEAGELDEKSRQRVRIAADASANPQLRIALEGVAEAEAEAVAIDHAIEALSASGRDASVARS
jgi:hypothetical protein